MDNLNQQIFTYIYFSSILNNKTHPNLFNISRASRDSKVKSLQVLLDRYENNIPVFFFHDDVRLAKHTSDFLPTERSNITSINMSEYTEEEDIKTNLENFLPKITNDDIIILDLA